MGIDGIGKRGGLPPGIDGAGGSQGPTGAGQADKTEGVGAARAPFRLDPSGAAGVGAAGATAPAGAPLARLQRGELDAQGYLDARVDEATRNLEGLSPTQLADVKSLLRERLASDPAYRELVQRATGAAPPEPSDDA